MKKETFIKIIKAIIYQQKRDCEFDQAFASFYEGYVMCSLTHNSQNQIINALETEMNDKDNTISWWLYDSPDAGNNKECAYVLIDKEKILLENISQLYDFLNKE